ESCDAAGGGTDNLAVRVESSAFSVFLSSNSRGDRLVVSGCRLGRQQFGNADQVVGDQIEHEIGSDLGYAAMFGFAHRAVLFAPTEDASACLVDKSISADELRVRGSPALIDKCAPHASSPQRLRQLGDF